MSAGLRVAAGAGGGSVEWVRSCFTARAQEPKRTYIYVPVSMLIVYYVLCVHIYNTTILYVLKYIQVYDVYIHVIVHSTMYLVVHMYIKVYST